MVHFNTEAKVEIEIEVKTQISLVELWDWILIDALPVLPKGIHVIQSVIT